MKEYTTLLAQITQARATQAQAQRHLAQVKAEVERQTLDAAGGYKALGSNEAERGMALEHALVGNTSYQVAQDGVTDARLRLELLEAQAAGLRFAQRERELALRERELALRDVPMAA